MFEVENKKDKYFKTYLKENTLKKLQKRLKEQEQKELETTNKNNYHPDILKAFKQIQAQEKFRTETIKYKNQILRQ